MRKGLGYHNRRSPFGFNPGTLFAGGAAGAWYDPSDASTLFSDTAGTTPSPTPGAGALSVVGLMLDKSQGLALGSELVTNGTFTSTSGWTAEPGAGVTLSAANNVLTITQTGGTLYGRAYQALSGLTVGQFYQYTAQVASNPGSLNVQIWAHTGFTGTPAAAQYSAVTSSTGNLVVRFQATATTMYVVMWFNTTAAGSVGFANASVKAIPGNHAISYNTTTARPELSARVNLLTYSEQFDNAAWTKAAGVTVTPNTDIAPDGTLTADTLTSGANELTQAVTVATNTLYTDSLYFKKTSGAAYQPGMYLLFTGGTTVIYAVRLNTDTGVATAVSAGGFTAPTSFSATDVGNYWRLSITGNSNNNTSGNLRLYANLNAAGGSGAGSQIIWGADLRPANIGTSVPAYQRIADQYTYDSSGFPRYLVFNGTASGMYTPANLNLSGTNKVTMFAGVRKQSDATAAVLTELSANFGSNNGALAVFAPSANTTADYYFGVTNTTTGKYAPTTYTAPISNVLSCAYDLSSSVLATQVVPKINGSLAQVNPSAGAASTGNFGTYPLYIGSRNNAGSWLNANIYSLIVVGAASTAAQITSTESWINVKEGGVY